MRSVSNMSAAFGLVALLSLLLVPSAATAGDGGFTPPDGVPAHGVIGVNEAQLSPSYWIDHAQNPGHVLLDRKLIDARNQALFARDKSMHDLRAIPANLDRSSVAGWIEGRSSRPTRSLYDVHGKPVSDATLDGFVDALALDAIPARQATRYGMVVQRAALRTFPTALRVFSSDDNTDIDRLQESAMFPGTPVVIAHASRDGKWLFVVAPRYAAWTEASNIAEGSKAAVFAYVDKAPYRVVTGTKVRTVFTPEQPRLSELQLDMGTRVALANVPLDQPVNGQHPYTSHAIELPMRDANGKLEFSPALLQKNTDTSADYLPLTRANIIAQAFKFLGERYGWGHSYNGRDCSGFVSDVYRSMGVQMPRNTSDQGVSPAFDRIHFEPGDSHDTRMAAVDKLVVGDLVYIPGHVLMVVGRVGDVPYVIHDTTGGSYIGADGTMHSMHLNGVSLTPLTPLMFNAKESYIDRVTNIVKMTSTTIPDSPRQP